MSSGCTTTPGVGRSSREPPDRQTRDRRGPIQPSAGLECLRDHQPIATRAAIEPQQWFCFFQSDAGLMAVSLHSVAEVVETDTLVQLAWSPPQVIGLCSHHHEVVPVVRLGPRPAAAEHSIFAGNNPGSGVEPAGDKASRDDRSACVVLILKTEQGAWGIQIESRNTVMSEESPESHAPRMSASGPVLIGVVRLAGTCYEILDAEETWRGLRSVITRWAGLINEAYPCSSLLSGDEAITAGPGGSGDLGKT